MLLLCRAFNIELTFQQEDFAMMAEHIPQVGQLEPLEGQVTFTRRYTIYRKCLTGVRMGQNKIYAS